MLTRSRQVAAATDATTTFSRLYRSLFRCGASSKWERQRRPEWLLSDWAFGLWPVSPQMCLILDGRRPVTRVSIRMCIMNLEPESEVMNVVQAAVAKANPEP